MNTVWVLIALVHSGHFIASVVPTLEFTTLERCQAAVQAFQAEADNHRGYVKMRCVRIEK